MKELRIGLVLYGGVALAVYINGVATEIWQTLRASRSMQDGDDGNLDSTSAIYHDLLTELKSSEQADELRIVVDAVAGTSAGGVNGAALFKAIVQGADASVLNKVWLDDADIKNLQGDPDRMPWYLRAAENVLRIFPTLKKLSQNLREQTSLEWTWIRDTVYTLAATKDPQKSPLKGDYFTTIIAASLARMSENTISRPLLPSRGTFDLFLTRTDLHGWPRHLPVSQRYHPKDLYERTHAHVMAYRVRMGGPPSRISDFELTYGARTTAGFPLAFAPVTYKEIRQNFLEGQPSATPPSEDEFADTHLREHRLSGFDTSKARMVDGGVLDNRPFTHVTRAIEAKPADFEVRRIVAYIEPDPEREIEPAPSDGPLTRDMLGNMFRLFRNEPILGDLRELQKRNETVSRILEFEAANTQSINAFVATIAGNLDGEITETRLNDWRRDANARLQADPVSGYLGYVGLKLRSASNVYSDIACRALNLPYESRHAFAVRRIIRMWMTDGPDNLLNPLLAQEKGLEETLTEEQIGLLQAFDIPFRLRRIRALVKAVNAAYENGADRSALDACKRSLADIVCRYEVAMTDSGDDLRQIEQIVESDINVLLEVLAGQPQSIITQHEQMLTQIFKAVARRFRDIGTDENQKVADAVMLLSGDTRQRIAHALIAFPYNDVMIYPLMETAGVTDPITVETLRISPYDARIVGDRITPLESSDFGAFKGFLSRRLREIDLLYGRLNGIERMVDLIVNTSAKNPDSPDMQTLRKRYTVKAMACALNEAEKTADTEIRPLIVELRKKLDAYENASGLIA